MGGAEGTGQAQIRLEGQLLCPPREDVDVGDAELFEDQLEECGPAGPGLHEVHPKGGAANRDRDARQARSRSEIHHLVGAGRQAGDSPHRVQHVALPQPLPIPLRDHPGGDGTIEEQVMVGAQCMTSLTR